MSKSNNMPKNISHDVECWQKKLKTCSMQTFALAEKEEQERQIGRDPYTCGRDAKRKASYKIHQLAKKKLT